MAANSSVPAAVDCGQAYFLLGNLLVYVGALPVFLAVVSVGLQRWRRRRRRSGPVAAATSHMDVFAYNMVALELSSMLAVSLYVCGAFTKRPLLALASIYLAYAVFPGVNLLHVLTCAERYLAAAHPLVYLRLKSRAGVRLRNLAVGGVWLLCAAWAALLPLPGAMLRLMLCLEASTLLAVSFCCAGVLRALIRPKPGDGGGTGAGADQSKRRALRAMTATMGALLLRFLSDLVSFVVVQVAPNTRFQCLVFMASVSFQLPSSLVLPLLFLQRAGKLAACRRRRRRRTPTTANQTS